MDKFFKANDTTYNVDEIKRIHTAKIEQLEILVRMKDDSTVIVEGLEAIDLMMMVKPSVFEGRRMRFPKRMWIVHNLIAHPLMQILALIGFRKQALWLHEVTVPRPLGKR